LSEEKRRLAFADRYFWLDDLPLDGEAPTQTNQINAMVKYFDKLAVVQHRTGVKKSKNFPPEMQVGIVPSKRQEAALLSETMKEINSILASRKLNKKQTALLNSAVDHLSNKGLLDEKLLMSNAKNQLLELVAHELIDDYKDTPVVKSLLGLIAYKEHKSSGVKTSDYLRRIRFETGVPEQMIRFQRFIPK
jgi:hypothetical protein